VCASSASSAFAGSQTHAGAGPAPPLQLAQRPRGVLTAAWPARPCTAGPAADPPRGQLGGRDSIDAGSWRAIARRRNRHPPRPAAQRSIRLTGRVQFMRPLNRGSTPRGECRNGPVRREIPPPATPTESSSPTPVETVTCRGHRKAGPAGRSSRRSGRVDLGTTRRHCISVWLCVPLLWALGAPDGAGFLPGRGTG
jgi:hypothetical protein